MKKRFEDGTVPESSRKARQDMASQVRQARQDLHMTQQVLAERAGTRRSNISRMESGTYNPSLDFIVKVADSMGKKVSIHLD